MALSGSLPQINFGVQATRGLLATYLAILNHGQVTMTTPELAPPSPNFHFTSTGEFEPSIDLTCIVFPTWRVFGGTRFELMTRVRFLDR
ncbi:hypothetical protein TNCV_3408291 [Trichonephila clavipes]|nr:hypothetical protein TNCV_3408291 [Trichonephila clavipes]